MNVIAKIALPAGAIDAGNRIGHIIDPDVGGANTYTLNASVNGEEPATHALVGVSLTANTKALVETKNPDSWLAALSQMAADRGREAPTMQDCIDVCAAIEIDDEVTVQLIPDDS